LLMAAIEELSDEQYAFYPFSAGPEGI